MIAPGGSAFSTGSAPGTTLGLGLPNPLTLLVKAEPSRTYAAPPSSSRLNYNGVTCPLAPGGRYAPTGLLGVFLVAR